MMGTLTGNFGSTYGVNWEGKDPDANIRFENFPVSIDMIETLGIKMLEGRSFSGKFINKENKLIFNEAAIEAMGLKDPVGKTVKFWGKDCQIIGVTRNFNFESLHENIKPLFFWVAPDRTLNIMVRIEPGKEKEAVTSLEKLYKEFNPGFTFDYKFLDADYQAQYIAEQRVSILAKYFAGMAILISCLGLFGLASFTAERRVKEIGIRKVLGAGELGIIRLLTVDFTRMVLLAIAIALPVGFIIARNWLAGYAYRIELKWLYFITAGVIALMIS